jgi:site-specific recombinase XerD
VLLSPYNDEGAQRDFRNIRRADVIELIEDIVGAGKHAAANRVHALISKVFSFAVDADLLDANPAARLKKRGVEKPRPRVLADKEILAFWHGIVFKPLSEPVGLACAWHCSPQRERARLPERVRTNSAISIIAERPRR